MPLTRTTDHERQIRDAGGDNKVPRDSKQRPRIVVVCTKCDGEGKVPSKKVDGRMNKCPGKCGPLKDDEATAVLEPGQRLRAYTRTTTYIDCIEDKSALMAWKGRMTLVGLALKPDLLDKALGYWDELQTAEASIGGEEAELAIKRAKDWLNRRAESAQTKAGASEKADRGTYLHGLSEMVDQGLELPDDVDFEAIIDMDAYRKATHPLFDIVLMEQLMTLDEFSVAGTPDRVSTVKKGTILVAPDGHVFRPGEQLITDLKTGTIEYGQLKMAMQLAIYSRSLLYDWETGKRSKIENLNQRWGVIMNVPAGSGECQLIWADLEMGWRAVQIAREIRQLRTEGQRALKPFGGVDVTESV